VACREPVLEKDRMQAEPPSSRYATIAAALETKEHTCLFAFPQFDAYHHALGINVANTKVQYFGNAQTCGIGKHDQHSMIEVNKAFDKRADLFQAENHGFRFRLFGMGDFFEGPVFSQECDIRNLRALTAILKADHEAFFSSMRYTW
jgi:hypothetical protein